MPETKTKIETDTDQLTIESDTDKTKIETDTDKIENLQHAYVSVPYLSAKTPPRSWSEKNSRVQRNFRIETKKKSKTNRKINRAVIGKRHNLRPHRGSRQPFVVIEDNRERQFQYQRVAESV